VPIGCIFPATCGYYGSTPCNRLTLRGNSLGMHCSFIATLCWSIFMRCKFFAMGCKSGAKACNLIAEACKSTSKLCNSISEVLQCPEKE